MYFQSPTEEIGNRFSAAFAELLEPADKLRIFSTDGNMSLVSRDLVRFFSPLVNNILKDVPCCTNSMIFMPNVSKTSVDHVLNIISRGITDFNAMSIKQIQEVHETATMLEIDLTNMEYVEKSKCMEMALNNVKARNVEIPDAEGKTLVNEMILEFKTENSEFTDRSEALLEADPVDVGGTIKVKEEPLDQNLMVPITSKNSVLHSPAKSHPFLAPTPPSEPESESTKSSSRSSPRHEQYLHRVKNSKKGSKRSITEETMAALAKMMKDPKRKPTIEEMEDLLSRTKSFKDAKYEESRREIPKSPDVLTRRSLSKDRRSSAVDRRSVSPERRTAEQLGSSVGYPGVLQSSPANFYMQTQHGQRPYSQFQHHPQMLQQGQVHPHVQYMMQPGSAVQGYVPGTVPVQYPYSTVQGPDHVQYGMVQPATGTAQYRARSPSPEYRRPPSDSSSRSDASSRFYDKVGKKSDRSWAEKKASLLTMSVEEKRHMTCLDWNSGLCPRLDSGKLCVFGGSKKKHICSKIVKDSKFEGTGYKVCWGKHREGKHPENKEREERVEFRGRERRGNSRERERRR